MSLTKVTYSMVRGASINVLDYGADPTGIADSADAIQAANDAAEVDGNAVFFPAGTYLSSKTLICKTPWYGVNTENYWQADGTGTIIVATGAGNGAQWTDIGGGQDVALFTPLIVLGRPDLTLRDFTVKYATTAWDAGIFIPALRRIQITNVDCIGNWAEGGLYLDATWSDLNTTLTTLHPEINADTGLNEINVQGGLFQGETWGIRLQGTNRNPDDYPSGWVWSYGGASDIVFLACRTVNIYIDAAVNNAAKAVQGIRFYSVDTRTGSRENMIYIDRANRVEVYGSYGETSSGTAKVSFTSNTGYVTFYGGRYINNLVYLNGVSTGAVLSSAPIPSIPNLSFYAYDGAVFLGHGVNLNGANVYPSTDNTGSLGSSSLNWLGVRARSVRSDSGTLNLRGVTSVDISPNSSAVDYTFENLAFKPGTDNTQALGGGSNRWSVVYAGTGSINTSDADTKQDISELSDAEKRVATQIKGLVKKFKFKDAVIAKGDSARIHIGVIAQEVMSAFQQEGLNAADYGILCYDEWTAQPEQRNEEGEITVRAVEAGKRYGIRYEELLAFIIAAI